MYCCCVVVTVITNDTYDTTPLPYVPLIVVGYPSKLTQRRHHFKRSLEKGLHSLLQITVVLVQEGNVLGPLESHET